MFSLELGEEVNNFACSDCGKAFKSVCGFIKKDGDAYSVYFATLETGHDDIAVGLTLSLGKWWDDNALDERHWVFIVVSPSETHFNMRIAEPERSGHAKFKPLGIPMSREEALESSLKDEFFAIADYVVDNDPAVRSYLSDKEVNIAGRTCRHETIN